MKKQIEEILSKYEKTDDKGFAFISTEIDQDNLVNDLNALFSMDSVVVKSLPTKEEIISEGAKQINDWLEGNTEREKQHYLIGFRRSYEYVLRRIR